MSEYDDGALFSQLAAMLHIGALQQMGMVENPLTKKRNVNLPLARITIDTLEMLQRRMNLSSEEQEFIESFLFDLRMRFVAASNAASNSNGEPVDDIKGFTDSGEPEA